MAMISSPDNVQSLMMTTLKSCILLSELRYSLRFTFLLQIIYPPLQLTDLHFDIIKSSLPDYSFESLVISLIFKHIQRLWLRGLQRANSLDRNRLFLGHRLLQRLASYFESLLLKVILLISIIIVIASGLRILKHG